MVCMTNKEATMALSRTRTEPRPITAAEALKETRKVVFQYVSPKRCSLLEDYQAESLLQRLVEDPDGCTLTAAYRGDARTFVEVWPPGVDAA